MENQEMNTSAEEVFDAVTYRMLTNNEIDGLLPLMVDEEAGRAAYTSDGWFNLVTAFGSTIKKKYVVTMIKSVLRTWLALDDYMIPRNELSLDLNQIYTNEDGTRFAFICGLTIEEKTSQEKFRTFMTTLSEVMEGNSDKNRENLYHIMNYIKNVNPGTLDTCEDMVDTLLIKDSSGTASSKPAPVKLAFDMLEGNIQAADKRAAEKVADKGKYPTLISAMAEKPEPEKKPERKDLDIMPGLFFRKEEPARTLPEKEDEPAAEEGMGYMIRVKTGEKKKLDSDETTIGKSSECDFTVTGTRTVSRQHASIYRDEDEYYIVDHNSTNATYLNGMRLDPGDEYTLMDGDEFMLADEKFRFIMK